MKRIGIIAAMNEEMQQIKNVMDNIVENNIHNLKFFEGVISGKNCVLVECKELENLCHLYETYGFKRLQNDKALIQYFKII